MIKSFADTDTKQVFNREYSKNLPDDLQDRAYQKLAMIDSAVGINDLRTPPGNQLEKLSGKRKSQYSVRINDQWRICFQWKDGDAYYVEIVDYH
jgi:proteic killer suppression protein